MSLSGHILGAAPGLVPSCIPEQLLRWGSGWEGAGMQEKGGLIGSNRAELRNRYLSKWPSEFCKFLHFGKQEGHCALPATQTMHDHQHTCLEGDVTQRWSASPLPWILSQEEGAGVWRKA